jgi:hypothetical protein
MNPARLNKVAGFFNFRRAPPPQRGYMIKMQDESWKSLIMPQENRTSAVPRREMVQLD